MYQYQHGLGQHTQEILHLKKRGRDRYGKTYYRNGKHPNERVDRNGRFCDRNGQFEDRNGLLKQ